MSSKLDDSNECYKNLVHHTTLNHVFHFFHEKRVYFGSVLVFIIHKSFWKTMLSINVFRFVDK